MANKLDKETFEQLARHHAQNVAANKLYGYGNYDFPSGVASGIEQALYDIFGYQSNNDNVNVSVAERVKERSAELVADWERTDSQLNGHYDMAGGGSVKVVSPYCGADYRTFHFDNGADSKRVDNSVCLHMICTGLLVKKKEPAVDYLDDDSDDPLHVEYQGNALVLDLIEDTE